MNVRSTIAVAIAASTLSMGTARAAVILFNFENEPIVETTPFSTTSNGLTATFAGSAAAEPAAFEISYNSSSGPFPAPYKGLSGAFLTTGLSSLDPSSPLTITFSAAVQSITFNFALGDSSGALSLTTNTGGSAQVTGQLASGFFYAEGGLTFTGAAFQSVTLSTRANGLAIDNLSVTTAAAAVPEPASALLLGAGLAGLAGLRRRARA